MSSIFDLFRKIETEKAPPAPVTHIVAGLGNYGREYEGTRHNAGFSAIDILSDRKKLSVTRAKFDALTDETVINTCYEAAAVYESVGSFGKKGC